MLHRCAFEARSAEALSAHPWNLPLSLSSGFSHEFFAIHGLPIWLVFGSLAVRTGCGSSRADLPLGRKVFVAFPEKTTTFNTVDSAFHAAFSSRRLFPISIARWKKFLGVPLSEWKQNSFRERSGKASAKQHERAEKGVLKGCRSGEAIESQLRNYSINMKSSLEKLNEELRGGIQLESNGVTWEV